MTRLGAGILVAMLLGMSGSAAAKDTSQSVLADAKALQAKGDAVVTAARYGDAVALAQAAGDLQAEQAAADALATWFESLPEDSASLGTTTKGATTGASNAASVRCTVLAATLRKLDPNRCGAFVSAPALARQVLFLATDTGSFAAVADAAAVTALHAAKKTSGRASATVAMYAEGLDAVARGNFDAATGPLQNAATEACRNGWFELAAHATTELAMAWTRVGAPEKALAAVTATADAFDGTCGVMLTGAWMQALLVRGSEPALAWRGPVERLITRQNRQGAGGTGTPGSPGASAGAVPVSDVGKLLQHLAKGKPFVAATRRPSAFQVQWITKPAEKTLVAFAADSVVLRQEGGVTLAFYGPSMGLRLVDPVNNTGGGIGGETTQSPVRAYYLLAEGETWSVSKSGIVTITR